MKTNMPKWISLFFIILFLANACTNDKSSRTVKKHFEKGEIAAIPFFPVRGNHETSDDVDYIINSLLPASGVKIHQYNNSSVNYYFDYNNSRFIVVDQFSEFSENSKSSLLTLFEDKGGNINSLGLKWVESIIDSSGQNIEHVFVLFHKPAFPRHRHIHDSFDVFPKERNAFWNMLLKHKDKVRAVFVAHTHYFSRMRVSNPATVDDSSFPNDSDGIFQIDGGTTGKEGYASTIVEIMIQGKNIRFRVVQAKTPSDNFKVIDEWSIISSSNDSLPVTIFAYICDNRDRYNFFQRSLEEIKNMTVNPVPHFGKMEFVFDGGDMDPVQKNHEEIYLKVFGTK